MANNGDVCCRISYGRRWYTPTEEQFQREMNVKVFAEPRPLKERLTFKRFSPEGHELPQNEAPVNITQLVALIEMGAFVKYEV